MQKTFKIKAKAIDTNDDESDWTEVEITIPRNRQKNNFLLKYVLERFPNLYLVLKQIF